MNHLQKLLIPALIALTIGQPIQAASSLPTGGTFVAGAGNMSTSGNTLTINQNSLKGIIDWNTFSIANGATVNFKNGSGATLNRVTGSTPTTLLGQLLATGNIYLLNPEGLLIGHGAVIHTGGDFLASTLNLPNSSFLNNNLHFSGDSTATVINLGDIASSGGNVYLIGRTVQNNGSLSSANGTTGLAAGSQVLVANSASGQKVAVQAPGGDVTNSGFINAAQVELKSNGGNIYALAGNNGGQINATGTVNQDGHVWLIATNGTTNVSSAITAANANGTGGSIETSGAHVNAGGATLKTGKGGNWLLDPDDLTIDSSLATTIETSLNGGTNVTEQTGSGNSGSGDLTVASNIAWTTAADLTLSAFRNIILNTGTTISNTGAGNLTLRADNTSTGVGTISGAGLIDFSGSTGNVALLYNPSSYSSPTSYSSNFGSVNGAWTAPTDGSVSSQYTAYMLVNSAANLQNLDANDAGTFALGKDIDLSSISNFSPLGTAYPYFTGIFDGMGHTISNLTIIDSSTSSNIGLFRFVSDAGQIRNLNLTNISITETGSSESLGGLVGQMYGTVSNVSVSGVVHSSTTPDYVGGLVGYNGGTVQNSSAAVTVDASAATSGAWFGGLTGYSDDYLINSSATGSVNAPNASGANVGGLTGGSEGPITNSYATGKVTGGDGASVGGLTGIAYFGLISGSYATGAASAGSNSYVGGLIGVNYYSVSDSYATGAVSGGNNADVGGLIGENSNAAITNSYATGAVSGGTANTTSGPANIGGLIGDNEGTSPISGSYATGAITTAGNNVGGLVGSDGSSSAISNSYATGNILATNTNGGNVGGLAGQTAGPVTNSYATGSVSAAAYESVGGLTGYSSENISNSYASGATSCSAITCYVGGLAGYNTAPITSSYATGSVAATGSYGVAGGLIGQSASGGTITGSYATGAVSGVASATVGGLVGQSGDTITQSWAGGPITCATGCTAGGLVGIALSPISVSYAVGSVNGGGSGTTAGGLVGMDGSSITDTYARGAVNGGDASSYVGGLVGYLLGGTITRSYSSGLVNPNSGSFIGGLVGWNTGSANITYSYWDNQASGISGIGVGTGDSTGVIGLTTAQLQSGVMPTGFNPGSPNNVWTAPTGVYPYFGWQGPLVTISGTAYNGSSTIASAGVGILSNGALIGNPTTNGSGFYTLAEPSNMINTNAGVLTILTSNGTANTFSVGPTFTGMDLHTGSLSLLGGSTANLSGITSALATTLGGNTGSYFLFTMPSGALTLTPGANISLASSAPTFTLDQPLTGGNIYINAAGNLAIANGAPITAGPSYNITLVDGGTFTNNAGANGLSVSDGGQWQVYSQNPANDTTGGLTPSFIQYNATYGVTTPAQSGDGLLYTLAPTIAVGLTGSVSKTYDGTTSATLTPANLTDTGAIQGDSVSVTAGSAAYANANTGTGIAVTASGFSVSANNDGIPVYGYQLGNTSATANIGAITAALTPPPPPTPNPTPAPTPTPASTTINLAINNAASLNGQIPTFTASYNGPAIPGVDIASLLSSLNYRITPTLNGPGTYTVTATGTAPDGYAFSIVAGTFTILDNSPKTLPSDALAFQPELPNLFAPTESADGLSYLSPANAAGLFQISVAPGFGISFAGFDNQLKPLAQSTFFGTAANKSNTFTAGAKP